jgi:hypothetical protein
VSSAYHIAPLFLIRIAGVPFEPLEEIESQGTAAAARELILTEENFGRAKKKVLELLQRPQNGLSPEVFYELRHAVRNNYAPQLKLTTLPLEASDYTRAALAQERAGKQLAEILFDELGQSRAALLASSREFFPRYLTFAAPGVQQLLLSMESASSLRNKRARERERHLLLYLQRIAAKNDTFSEFGPSSWGRIDPAISAVQFNPVPGIAKRDAFLERWTAHALAAAVNSDPEIFPELRPRPNPNGLLVGDSFVFTDTGERHQLEPHQISLLAQCDGSTPVYAITGSHDAVRDLVTKRIVIAAVEVPALDPFAFEVLHKDVAAWRAGAPQARWLPIIRSLAELPKKFAGLSANEQRQQVLTEARTRLATFGAARKEGQRSLYSAVNPIAEECFRQTGFVISEKLINEVTEQAEPWIDFWRDSYAFVASRVAAGLRQVLDKTPLKNGALPLPAFLRACELGRLPLTGPGLVGLAHLAFQEIKEGFRQRMKGHGNLAEYELTTDDCHFVRDNFQYEKFDEFTYPSADLQLAAESVEAVSRGDYQWILSELHPPAALLHHGGYWSCPDTAELGAALSSVSGKAFHFGFFAADFTAHTAVRAFDAVPQLMTFVAPQRADPHWKSFPPAHTEVYIDRATGDVRLRHTTTQEDLGSFARNWVIPLGFHPFQFGMSPQMPRLRCGRVIVQRRAWTVSSEELGGGDFSGISRDLVVAVEKLRAMKDWPRFVYIRPTEQALRRSGAEGRDKDTKPVFIDLESYLFLEIFHRWLTKSGQLEVTEMLPAPADLWWQERDGRRTFELRTLIVPRP